MKLSKVGELSLLDTLRRRFKKKAAGLVLGIGDDCAVIRPRKQHMLLTTDMMVEGVHFDLKWTTPFQLGYKLISVNVSDIYAMGGIPEYVLLDFAAPGDFDTEMFDSLCEGIKKALKAYGMVLIGGDISSADKVALSATVTGHAPRVIARSGAGVGDLIYVTGHLGDSAAGLMLMKNFGKPVAMEDGEKAKFRIGWETVRPLIKRHLMPEAVRPDRFVKKATAMIDISDGLLIDLKRVCRESRVGARIYEERIPVSEGLGRASAYLNVRPLDLAMAGGEDYELLFTAPKGARVDAFCIGEVAAPGMKLIDRSGKSRDIPVRGYQHFAL